MIGLQVSHKSDKGIVHFRKEPLLLRGLVHMGVEAAQDK